MGSTRFAETEALIAVMEGADDRAQQLLSDMLPGELMRLEEHAHRLARLCSCTRHEREAIELTRPST